MPFAIPEYSKNQVNRAGQILISDDWTLDSWDWAYRVLTNWRACHGYPMNTFQATLRDKLRNIDQSAIVAQRLKRLPSIITKLQRFESMQLARMQDIGGLRSVVSSITRVRKLEDAYRKSKFKHQLVSSKDYINAPKGDGYRGIHLVFRYKNERAPRYDGLHLELQLRTRLQHAWATAVETMGTFLGQALKSGQGDREWRVFFEVSSAALAHLERSPPVPGYESLSRADTFSAVAKAENRLKVLSKLRGFSIAATAIETQRGPGAYHLIVLDSEKKTVSIRPYPKTKLEQANIDYGKIEERARQGEKIEAVLVSAGPVHALRRAYPNYFLDTHGFIAQIDKVIGEVARQG
jgi:putative GTP pyrophosphokinase